MSLSSGSKTALGEALSWAIAGVILVGTFIYYDELKAAIAPIAHSRLAENPSSPNSGTMPQAAAHTPRAPQAQSSSGYVVELAADRGGQFSAMANVNGRAINVLVDTGATYVGLTYEDAERAGIFVNESDFKHKIRTANGTSSIAVVNIGRVSIGDIEVRDVQATVSRPGRLHVTLLGMNFLRKLRRAQIQDGRLILEN